MGAGFERELALKLSRTIRSRKLSLLPDLLDSQFASIQLPDDELLETRWSDAAPGRADGDRKAEWLEGWIVVCHAILRVRGSIAQAQIGLQSL